MPGFVKEWALRNGFACRSAPELAPGKKQNLEVSPGAKAALYG